MAKRNAMDYEVFTPSTGKTAYEAPKPPASPPAKPALKPVSKTGEQLKQEALDKVEVSGSAWLDKARQVARDIAQRTGKVTADDVIEQVGLPPNYKTAGAIFRYGFRRVGYTKSTRPSNHARLLSVWALEN